MEADQLEKGVSDGALPNNSVIKYHHILEWLLENTSQYYRKALDLQGAAGGSNVVAFEFLHLCFAPLIVRG